MTSPLSPLRVKYVVIKFILGWEASHVFKICGRCSHNLFGINTFNEIL